MIKILPLTSDAVESAAALEKSTLETAWSAGSISGCLNNEAAYYLTAECEGVIAGIICFYIAADDAQLINLAVAPAFRRRGVASALIDAMLKKVKEIGAAKVSLEVAEDNTSALLLYEKKGFVRAGIRKNFYAPGRDAFVYTI